MIECQHIDLTPQEFWDPLNVTIGSLNHLLPTSQVDHFARDDSVSYLDLPRKLEGMIQVSGFTTTSHGDLTPELLSSLWNISLPNAKRTLDATTHDHIRIPGPINRRVKTIAHQQAYKQLGGYLSKFALDTFKANVESTRGNKYFQLFCNRGNYVTGTPIARKGDACHALDRFLHDVGIATELLTDGAKELHLGEWGNTCRRHKISQRITEPHSPWQNPAELSGGIVKRKVQNTMRKTNTPL